MAVYVKVGSKYVAWSTICDAPLWVFDDLNDLSSYHRQEWGRNGEDALSRALERLELYGVSHTQHVSADEFLAFNRAGRNETTLTKAQLVSWIESTGVDEDAWVEQRPAGVNTLDHPDGWWTMARYLGEAA